MNDIYFILVASLIPVYGFILHLIDKAKNNIKLRNDLLAFAYLIRDIGPSVSSVAVVGIVAVDDKKLDLFLVFILGILCSYFGRKLRDLIFEKTKKRKEVSKNSLHLQWRKKMKYPKNKSQIFMAVLKALLPSVPQKIKKTKNGYSTLGFLKDCSSEVAYDIKSDIIRISKKAKEYIGGGEYQDKEDIKRYKIELKSDRMLLHPLD